MDQKNKINKKGEIAVGRFLMLLLIISSGVIILLAISSVQKDQNDYQKEALCRASIITRGKMSMPINAGIASIDLKIQPPLCSTREVEITGNREEIMSQMAYYLSRCYWMFGEGRFEQIFHGNTVHHLPALFGTNEHKNKCFTCYNAVVNEGNFEPISPKEFTEYLKNNKHGPSEMKYADYLENTGEGTLFIMLESIAPNTAYAVEFLPKMKPLESTSTLGWIIGAVAVVAGVTCVIATAGICAGVIATAVAGGTVIAGGAILIEQTAEVWENVHDSEERDFTTLALPTIKNSGCYNGDLSKYAG
jgi:hypothetical protein